MRQLLPDPDGSHDPLVLYPADERPPLANRPWVMCNMAASADGATAIDGVSAELGGEGDREVFRAIRASCDWVVAAAGTVRAERYRIPRPASDVARRRTETGRDGAARLAVVTASADLDPELPLFADQRDGDALPLVITGTAAAPENLAALGERAQIAQLPMRRPTAAAVLEELFRRNARVVLSEGGPSFNGQLAEDDLIDELCLTISPHLVGGTSSRIVEFAGNTRPLDLRLDRLLEHDGALFARYVRR